MKGSISLGEFIEEVKKELRQAQETSKEPMFQLSEVNLEVSFGVDASAKAEGKMFFVDLSGEAKASQLHKVSLKLTPLETEMPMYLDKNPGRYIIQKGGIALDNPLSPSPSTPTDLGDFNPDK
ncbi:MAG TPA: trypco2 family protein [Sulfuricella sp.]|nr:trypco2 family protein [Sulfuricella sp.]